MATGSHPPSQTSNQESRATITTPFPGQNTSINEQTLHRLLMEMHGQVQNFTSIVGEASTIRSGGDNTLAVVPATSRSDPIVYNYQSPSNSTVHHSIIQCEPPFRSMNASITSLPDAAAEHTASHTSLAGLHLILASPWLRKACHVFSDDTEVAQEQLKWLISQGYSRQVELYPSQTNDQLEESIRNAFGARATPGRLDLVKLRGSTMELNQDTWPIHSLANGFVSLAAYFRGCKHAFLFTNDWHDPSPYMEPLEEDIMRGWYAATKEANLKIHHHFNVDDDESMKDFLSGQKTRDDEVTVTQPPDGQTGTASPGPYEHDFDQDIHQAQASPVYESAAPTQFKATAESDDSGDDMDFGSTINSRLKPAPVPTTSKLPGASATLSGGSDDRKAAGYQSESEDADDIDQQAKFKLGQRIQKAILFSNQGYYHFKQAKMDLDALLRFTGTRTIKQHVTSARHDYRLSTIVATLVTSRNYRLTNDFALGQKYEGH
ncbi:hypothetical protein QFC21_007266 [Naganishia friedmannii]|uniref:Uncharacterized protein n=1 Tax=Naganishia friedmannii TaxID=89922 RepID=A0ACC2UWP3_9TREE|nr:hypothetical protein QFC21_007266 [Naganishia friedmannii]